jgi:hypothetical protein
MATVFIPSRGRHEMLAQKVLPKWMAQDAKVYVVVEPSQYEDYCVAVSGFCNKGGSVDVLELPHADRGINFSRNYIVKIAADWGLTKIIQADDDIWPSPDSDVNRLFEWDGLNCLGIGIMVPFYGLMFGNKTIKAEDRPLMSKGALGKQRLQATWYVHAGVWGSSVSNRYTEGGINDFHSENAAARLAGQEHSHRIIYRRWGARYVSDPGKKMMFRWQTFMDDKVPDWRERIDWVKI